MEKTATVQQSERPAAGDAGAAIAHLQQRVRAWMDGDKLLPADGSFLLTVLDQALAGLSGEGKPAAKAALETFARRAQELMEAGVLAGDDGRPTVEAAAALIVGLPGTGGIDRDRTGRPGEVSPG